MELFPDIAKTRGMDNICQEHSNAQMQKLYDVFSSVEKEVLLQCILNVQVG